MCRHDIVVSMTLYAGCDPVRQGCGPGGGEAACLDRLGGGGIRKACWCAVQDPGANVLYGMF